MSNFVKPSTPTKSRSNFKTLTPIKSKSMSCINISSVSGSNSNLNSTNRTLDDSLYLHLETIKRNLDNEVILKQKVEDAYKAFEEKRCKHANLVAKYAALVKMASTRKVLLRNNLVVLPMDSAETDAKSIKMKLSSGNATDYISALELNKFKEMLQQMGKYNNLRARRSELVEFQKTTQDIRYLIEAIEISLDKCTTQGLDHFINSLDMENYPALARKYDLSEN
ncbi:hypothetical protein DOY81_000745 [Sarcophaga bullata]|nr:hypothetical protein DOY81_000745 [Sarcophaga bullata]